MVFTVIGDAVARVELACEVFLTLVKIGAKIESTLYSHGSEYIEKHLIIFKIAVVYGKGQSLSGKRRIEKFNILHKLSFRI
jgi:hypothetical protein